MRTRTTIQGLLGVVSLLVAGSSMAAVITPDLNPAPTACTPTSCWTDATGAPNQPGLAELAALVGIDATGLEILYKDETNGFNDGVFKAGVESGPFAGSYTTAFLFPAGETEEQSDGANVVWGGGSFIDCGVCYLWVKDGNGRDSQGNPVHYYVFDIGWWNGQETLKLRNFWSGGQSRGAISNIGIFGRGGGMQVPEPAPLALLGMAAIGLGLVRRRRSGS